MPKLPLGLCDTLLTRELQQELEHLDSALTAAQTEPLDKADAHIHLARHMATMLRQVLTTIESDHRPDASGPAARGEGGSRVKDIAVLAAQLGQA